jgi:hypothetical protein
MGPKCADARMLVMQEDPDGEHQENVLATGLMQKGVVVDLLDEEIRL